MCKAGNVPVATVKTINQATLKPKIEVIQATSSSKEAQEPMITPVPVATSSTYFLVDDTGYLFKKVDEQTQVQPGIDILDNSLKVGSKISGNNISKILNSFKKLTELSLYPKKAELLGENLYTSVDNGEKTTLVVLSFHQDLEKEFAYLKLILTQASRDGKNLERVDLRFDKPYIMYSS